MWELIVIVFLYVLVLGLFRILGGIAAAGDAFREWGRASTTVGPKPGSSS